MSVASLVIAAYLIGSIPFALILARRWGAPDLRRVGSGNLGAANVLRSSGILAGVTVMVLDIAKGAGSVMLAQRVAPAAAGIAAVVGHVYPVWLKFRGGKGVATACGVFTVLTPAAVPAALAVFVTSVWISKYISVGSVLASLALPLVAYAIGSPISVFAAALSTSALIVVRHRTNLGRLRAGTERRLGSRIAPSHETRGT
jgi:glycerol-3-phosphate acyltransferase PlsY